MDTNDLSTVSAQDYAIAQNVKRIAEALQEGCMFYALHPEDNEFWAEQAAVGIKTGADVVRRDLLQEVSDLYKETHGIRPRHLRLSERSTEELRQILRDL